MQGPTSSPDTGPDSDHTNHPDPGVIRRYMYLEASGPKLGTRFKLRSEMHNRGSGHGMKITVNLSAFFLHSHADVDEQFLWIARWSGCALKTRIFVRTFFSYLEFLLHVNLV